MYHIYFTRFFRVCQVKKSDFSQNTLQVAKKQSSLLIIYITSVISNPLALKIAEIFNHFAHFFISASLFIDYGVNHILGVGFNVRAALRASQKAVQNG